MRANARQCMKMQMCVPMRQDSIEVISGDSARQLQEAHLRLLIDAHAAHAVVHLWPQTRRVERRLQQGSDVFSEWLAQAVLAGFNAGIVVVNRGLQVETLVTPKRFEHV